MRHWSIICEAENRLRDPERAWTASGAAEDPHKYHRSTTRYLGDRAASVLLVAGTHSPPEWR
jgi:hypothetical protein